MLDSTPAYRATAGQPLGLAWGPRTMIGAVRSAVLGASGVPAMVRTAGAAASARASTASFEGKDRSTATAAGS